MKIYPMLDETLPSLSEQAEADQLIKRVRKLRWIGMDERAAEVELRLRCVQSVGKASVLAGPFGTD